MWKRASCSGRTRVFRDRRRACGRRAGLRLGLRHPKNSPNKDGAYAYLDAMLDKSAQEAFAVDMGYNRGRARSQQTPSASPPTRSRNSSISTTTT